jgi:hypothetical protein
MRRLPAPVLLLLVLAACAEDPIGTGSGVTDPPAPWGDREPIVYSVVVAEVLDDIGSPPPVVYVVDGVCAEAGQVEPAELTCVASIPQAGKDALVANLERYVPVEFVSAPEEAVDDAGQVLDDGLLFWFGPLKDRKSGEVRVGANYSREPSGDALGVNLALEDQAGSWVVTGAAGLGGCPA